MKDIGGLKLNQPNNGNLILNVGCGGSLRYPFTSGTLGEVSKDSFTVHMDLKIDQPKQVFFGHNVVRADGQILPFRAKVFHRVYASHILEHCLFPPQALKEWGRVSREFVDIRVPDKVYQSNQEQNDHLYTWTQHSLENLLKIFFVHVEVTTNFRISLGRRVLDALRLHAWVRYNRLISKGELKALAFGFRGRISDD